MRRGSHGAERGRGGAEKLSSRPCEELLLVTLPSALISPDPNGAQIILSPDGSALREIQRNRVGVPSHPLIVLQAALAFWPL